jgi:hypothetical protein
VPEREGEAVRSIQDGMDSCYVVEGTVLMNLILGCMGLTRGPKERPALRTDGQAYSPVVASTAPAVQQHQ